MSSPPAFAWKPVPPPAPVTLRGRYVTLEPLDTERHTAALWQALGGHDDLWTWMFDGPFPTSAALRLSLAEKQAAKNAVFLAILPAASERMGTPDASPASAQEPVPTSAQAAGFASYMRIEPAHGVVEVGNIMLSPLLQRTRAATEAMFLMAGYVFDQLGYRRYEWKCNAENAPSRRAALRLGFTFEGIFRQHMVVKGKSRDTAWFALLHTDWPARKRAFEAWLNPANFDADGRQKQSLAAIGNR